MSRRAWMLAALLCSTALCACLGQSPETRRQEDLGPELPGMGPGPNHRAGQPCLVCHGEEGGIAGPTFVLAGTVFEAPTSTRGASDVRVEVTDGKGRSFTAHTNRVGTFFVTEDGTGTDPVWYRDGRVSLPYSLAYPLRVSLHKGDVEQTMRGLVWREGSCAACHGGSAAATSNGRIFLGGAP